MNISAAIAGSKGSVFSAAFWLVVLLLAGTALYVLCTTVQTRRQGVVGVLMQAAADTQNGSVVERKANLANTTKDERAALAAAAIGQGGSADFIAQVESLADSAGVSLQLSGIDEQAPKGNLAGALTLSAKFTGSWSACMRFAALAETLPVVTSVAPLTLSYDAEKKIWTGTLTLSALSFDNP